VLKMPRDGTRKRPRVDDEDEASQDPDIPASTKRKREERYRRGAGSIRGAMIQPLLEALADRVVDWEEFANVTLPAWENVVASFFAKMKIRACCG
jgi:hypothetical protein